MAHLINCLISASQLQFQAPALTTLFLVTLFIVSEEQRPYMKKWGVILVPIWFLGISLQGWTFVVLCTMGYFWANDRINQLAPLVEDSGPSTVHGELHKRYGNLYRN